MGGAERVDVVIPVYNEQALLEHSVEKLREFLTKNLKRNWRIVIANNASTDNTSKISKKLAAKYFDVTYTNLEKKGRGRALKKAWTGSDAAVLTYMDVDLSTDLAAFPRMVESVFAGADIAVGSRFAKGSKVTRGAKREMLSRGYMLLLKLLLGARFSDAQCGFKAVNRKVIAEILPRVKDDNWFFDTELLMLAQKNRFKIVEVPVVWHQAKGSKVEIGRTVQDYLQNIMRLRKSLNRKSQGG